ncbi:hypothetical protein [Verrucomicrobium spinosum]|uniref:hypothetical protein n=1 Tax=Verrucomicrobium spinosum TaxID=2736 RepID=UPI00017458D1|nr:hypothetical protein [Verrucomicrobium spinosum]
MNTKLVILCLVMISTLRAFSQEPKWEYRVTQLATLGSVLNEDQLKTWAKTHRPKVYEAVESRSKGNGDTKKVSSESILDAVDAAGDVESLLVEYYLNSMAEQGWELSQATDKMLYLRRHPQPGK